MQIQVDFSRGINYLGTRHCNWILPSRFRILSPALRPASSRSQLETLAKVSFRVQVMIAPVASAACFVPRPGVERFSMHWKRKDDDRRLVFPLKILWRSFARAFIELEVFAFCSSTRDLEDLQVDGSWSLVIDACFLMKGDLNGCSEEWAIRCFFNVKLLTVARWTWSFSCTEVHFTSSCFSRVFSAETTGRVWCLASLSWCN